MTILLITGKIALAHLNEFPDYYIRLEKLEKEAEKYFRANPALAEGEKKIFRDWLENMKKAAEKPR